MSRKRKAVKRVIKPDRKYDSVLISKLINKITLDGKKSIAENIIYRAFDILQQKAGKHPLEVFESALNNIKPDVEVKSRRIGGATYQIPVEVPRDRQVSLAYNWLIGFARGRKSRPMYERLAQEILDAYNKTGSVLKKKEDTHRMAEANRAFAHFRW